MAVIRVSGGKQLLPLVLVIPAMASIFVFFLPFFFTNFGERYSFLIRTEFFFFLEKKVSFASVCERQWSGAELVAVGWAR